MSTLREYLLQKRQAVLSLKKKHEDEKSEAKRLSARVSAEGRSGIRRIRIGDFQIIMDSGPELAGYSLGPGSQHLQLGVLGSCLTHIFLIQAALREVPLDSLEVEISADQHPRAGTPGLEDVPIYPHNLRYVVHIASPASPKELEDLRAAVEENCPLYNFAINPQRIEGSIKHVVTAA